MIQKSTDCPHLLLYNLMGGIPSLIHIYFPPAISGSALSYFEWAGAQSTFVGLRVALQALLAGQPLTPQNPKNSIGRLGEFAATHCRLSRLGTALFGE